MKNYFLLLLLLLIGYLPGRAATVQGTLTDVNSQPVANAVVYVNDSLNTFPSQVFLQATTNASGFYSVTLPSTLASGATIYVSTASCGMMLMNTHTYTGANISSNFVICTTTPLLPDTVSGTVTLGTSASPGYPAIVYLIEQTLNPATNSYILTLLDSTLTNTQGDYRFLYSSNTQRTVLVKAALLPGSSNYASYLPTYYTSSLSWSGAALATFIPGNTDIQMIAGVNPGGPGFIGGSVLQGANKTTGPGDPLSRRILILTTMSNVPVAYTYSNASGQFSFGSLAYGTYKLFGDVWGKQNPALTITINAANQSVNDIIFEENSGDFTGRRAATSVNNVLSRKLTLYPNPVKNELYISGAGDIKGRKDVSVMTATGSTVYNGTFDETGGAILIPMAGLADGFYFVKINTQEGQAVYRIIK